MQAEDKIDILSEALQQILNWCMAYPVRMFPEPDWRLASDLLKVGGISLDQVSGANMRYCLEGVGSIAMAALEAVRE